MMDEYELTYKIDFFHRPGFRYATSHMKVSEDKKFFYSKFTVTTNDLSHAILKAFYG